MYSPWRSIAGCVRPQALARTAVVFVLSLGAVTGVWAQEMAVPVEVQLQLFARILPFDRQLRERVGDEIVVGVVYQRRLRASLNAMNAVSAALDGELRIADLPVRHVPLDAGDGAKLTTAIATHDVDVLYICPLRAIDFGVLTAASRAHGVLTYTGVPDYVAEGVAVGIGTRAGRPLIMINLEAARAEGAEFSSELLKLVHVVGGW